MLSLNGTFYTLKELALRWGCAVVSVNYHIQKGALKATKIGQTYIVHEDDAATFTESLLNSTRARLARRVKALDSVEEAK